MTELMKIRCPKDGTATKRCANHVAIDVRLPLDLDTAARLLIAFGECGCGCALMLAPNAEAITP